MTGDREAAAAGPRVRDVRPVVRMPNRGLSKATIAAIVVAAALILFLVLNARRQALSSPATAVRQAPASSIAAPPPLALSPDLYAPMQPELIPSPPSIIERTPLFQAPARAPASAPVTAPFPQIDYAPLPAIAIEPARRVSAGPALIIDASVSQPGEAADAEQASSGAPGDRSGALTSLGARARASMIANHGETVPQGTLIPAVLETAYDSTRPSFARALVQRDIRSFNGSRVLIPRGSRLIGEFGTAVEAGQRRAMIIWSRLIRPDGVTVSIVSPATDQVGRGGVRARVDTHFWQRFSGAILQSALDVGVNLAARAASAPVIVAVPGSIQGATGGARPAEITPTLSIPAATSISVFVARDLDFSDVAGRP